MVHRWYWCCGFDSEHINSQPVVCSFGHFIFKMFILAVTNVVVLCRWSVKRAWLWPANGIVRSLRLRPLCVTSSMMSFTPSFVRFVAVTTNSRVQLPNPRPPAVSARSTRPLPAGVQMERGVTSESCFARFSTEQMSLTTTWHDTIVIIPVARNVLSCPFNGDH